MTKHYPCDRCNMDEGSPICLRDGRCPGMADWWHLKPYGYAPGEYMAKCHRCKQTMLFVDKRAITCRPCAEAMHAAASAAPAPAAQPVMPTCGDCTITSESAEPKAKAERAAEGRADNPESPARSASADGAVSASVAQPVMPEPFDWCYEWDGPYGTRKFSAAPHNGARCDRSVALYNADQMRAYAAALSEARCAQLQAERDACAPYLKEGETPAQRIQREIDDNVGVLGLLAKERARCAQMVEALEKARSRVKHWRRAGIDDETLALLDAALTAARKVRPNV